jgi:glycosyltransferase involved in cell wall biosynthesis
MRNEEQHISNCLTSLLCQTYPSLDYEVIVVDGKSSDRSREIVEAFCREHPNLLCLDNPAAIAPCAMNIGIRASKGEIIIRADGHNAYPADYIENCVKYLEQTGAENVGGPWITVPANDRFGARLVAAVLASPFGVGNSKFRISAEEGFVETVPFGAFRRELFDRIGMYNEKLVRNQDVELNARIRRAGGRIYQTPALQTKYHPVAGFRQLLALTFRTCQWHLFSFCENVRTLGVRHFAPALFLIAVLCLSFGSVWNRTFLFCLITLLLSYLIAGLAIAIFGTKNYGFFVTLVLPLACFCFHISYGLGTLAGIRYLLRAPSSRPIRAGLPVS